MNRERAEELLGDYVQGHLHDEELRAVEAALESSPELRDLCDGIRALYAIPGPGLPPAPSEPRFLERALAVQRQEDAFAPRARSFFQQVRRLRWAATVLVALLLGLTVLPFIGDTPEDRPEAPTFEPLSLLPVSLSVPTLPAAWPEDRWYADRDEALEAGRLTSRPVVFVYTVRGCPRCRGFQMDLEANGTPASMTGFVRCRLPLQLQDPPELGSPWPDREAFLHCPAVRVARGDLETETIWEVTAAERLSEAVRRWETLEQEAGRSGPSVTRGDFEDCLHLLKGVPVQAAQHRFNAAAAMLQEVSRRIADADHPLRKAARTLHTALDEARIRELERIRGLVAGDARQQAQGRDLAKRLAPLCAGLPDHAELLRIAE